MPDEDYTTLADDTDGASPLIIDSSPPASAPAEAAPEPPVTPPSAAPVQPAEEDDLEPHVVEDRLTRERMIPVAQAIEYRRKAREHREQAQALEGRVKDIETKLAEAVEANRQWQAYVASQQPAQHQQPAEPTRDTARAEQQAKRDEAVKVRGAQLAKRYDWYQTDGSLDVERGIEEAVDREREIEERSNEIVRRQVGPVAGHLAAQTVQARQRFLDAKLDELGVSVDRSYLQQIGSMIPPQLLMDPNVQTLVNDAAIGHPITLAVLRGDTKALEAMGFTPKAARAVVQQGAVVVPEVASPPIVTEPQGQRPPTLGRFSGNAARAAKETGMTMEEYEKRYGKTTPTGWTVLDSDVG